MKHLIQFYPTVKSNLCLIIEAYNRLSVWCVYIKSGNATCLYWFSGVITTYQ